MAVGTSGSRPPVLVCLGGLPGVGKSTVARGLVGALRSPYVRIDTIETAITRAEGAHAAGNGWELPPGYAVGYDLAAEQLRLGLDVVVESVNPLVGTRRAWFDTATTAGAGLLDVELVCSDRAEHRRRAASRTVDVTGLVPPTWEQIETRQYEPWDADHPAGRLVLDTAVLTAAEVAEMVLARLAD